MEPETKENRVARILAKAREEARTEYEHKIRQTDDLSKVRELRTERRSVCTLIQSAIKLTTPEDVDPEDIETGESPFLFEPDDVGDMM